MYTQKLFLIAFHSNIIIINIWRIVWLPIKINEKKDNTETGQKVRDSL